MLGLPAAPCRFSDISPVPLKHVWIGHVIFFFVELREENKIPNRDAVCYKGRAFLYHVLVVYNRVYLTGLYATRAC